MLRFALAMTAAVATVATPDADAVLSLPGYGKLTSPQFSGFLNASAAEPGTMLHYWFAAAASPDWKNMPVVLWLNGGPGASSLIGMLQEQGPLIIDRAGGLLENPWAWTKLANLVALESPAGVGYSYCEAMKHGGACANTDISTAKAAHAALLDLFGAKFPELRTNAFFITGESYAGVYSPTLAAEIVAGNAAGSAAAKINLVGMAVGDPCTDNAAQRDSMDMLWWAHKNGLVPERTLNYHTAAYLMRDDVKAALHVNNLGVGRSSWPGPAPGWSYTSSYDACNQGAIAVGKSMVDFYRELAPALRGKIVVFNGDTDPCVSYEGTRTALERVGFEITQPMRPWFYNESAAPAAFLERKDLLFGPSLALVGAGAQFGGEVVDYEHGLSFATVHGSGHMAPTFRPRAALQLLRHVLEDTPFAPPVPADAALAAMADADFDEFLDEWVVTAESSQYVRGA